MIKVLRITGFAAAKESQNSYLANSSGSIFVAKNVINTTKMKMPPPKKLSKNISRFRMVLIFCFSSIALAFFTSSSQKYLAKTVLISFVMGAMLSLLVNL